MVDLEQFDYGIHYNVTSMVQMVRYAVPAMRSNGKGAIVNMSSICGLTGGSPGVFYSTSKGAIVQMTRAMAGHHGAENIRVNCVCPGLAYTPMARSKGISEEMRHERKGFSFLKYEGTALDIAYGSSRLDLIPCLTVNADQDYAVSYAVPLQQGGEVDYGSYPTRRWRGEFGPLLLTEFSLPVPCAP